MQAEPPQHLQYRLPGPIHHQLLKLGGLGALFTWPPFPLLQLLGRSAHPSSSDPRYLLCPPP
jgi:hypothetical protein